MKTPLDRRTINKLLDIILCVYIQRSHQLRKHALSVHLSNHAKGRRPKKRIPWSYVDSMLNDRQFR